jgi:hypothetical protein
MNDLYIGTLEAERELSGMCVAMENARGSVGRLLERAREAAERNEETQLRLRSLSREAELIKEDIARLVDTSGTGRPGQPRR